MSDQDYPSKVMEPSVYQPDLLTKSLYWIEPELPHKQVIDLINRHSNREGVHFYTRGKVITSRWPDPKHRGVNLGFPQND